MFNTDFKCPSATYPRFDDQSQHKEVKIIDQTNEIELFVRPQVDSDQSQVAKDHLQFIKDQEQYLILRDQLVNSLKPVVENLYWHTQKSLRAQYSPPTVEKLAVGIARAIEHFKSFAGQTLYYHYDDIIFEDDKETRGISSIIATRMQDGSIRLLVKSPFSRIPLKNNDLTRPWGTYKKLKTGLEIMVHLNHQLEVKPIIYIGKKSVPGIAQEWKENKIEVTEIAYQKDLQEELKNITYTEFLGHNSFHHLSNKSITNSEISKMWQASLQAIIEFQKTYQKWPADLKLDNICYSKHDNRAYLIDNPHSKEHYNAYLYQVSKVYYGDTDDEKYLIHLTQSLANKYINSLKPSAALKYHDREILENKQFFINSVMSDAVTELITQKQNIFSDNKIKAILVKEMIANWHDWVSLLLDAQADNKDGFELVFERMTAFMAQRDPDIDSLGKILFKAYILYARIKLDCLCESKALAKFRSTWL